MKIRLKLHSRFSLEKFLLFVAVFCVATFALLEHMSISLPLFSALKWPLIYAGGACVLTQINLIIKTFMKKKNFFVWLAVLLFCAALMLGAYQNRNPAVGEPPMRNTTRTVLYLIELMMLMVWVSEKGYGQYLIKYLFRYVLIVVLITDVVLFTGIRKFYSGSHEAYLIGTKFTVSYMHMNLLTLWVMQTGKRLHAKQFSRLWLCLAAVFLIAVSVRVECMTGIIGCVTLFICLFVVDSPKSKRRLRSLTSPTVLMLALVGNLIFPFVSELLVSVPAINYFIVDVLGRTENLTGRTNIFNIFSNQMTGHWLYGYGLGNQNAAAMELFGYANAQNAMLQWILQGGILATVTLTLFMRQVFKQTHKADNYRRVMPLVVLVYVYIVLGTVETTFSMSYLLWLGVIFALISESPKPERLPQPDQG